MTQPTPEKILFVDDDPNILQAYQRQLRKLFRMDTAAGGEPGLQAISTTGPYAVVVADMRMPGMDGIQFLSRVKEVAPETVRMMLTGNADQKTAIDAVNEGNIFRFLTKPCTPERLAHALNAGIEQYRLVTAEKELLEKTLNGSVKLLTETLSLANPVAFGRASRIKRYVRHIVSRLNLAKGWQFELAAMLSQIGCVTLAPETLERVYAGQPLTKEEREAFESHPSVGYRLVANIPRLEPVARMIQGQKTPFSQDGSDDSSTIALGAQMLKVALDFDERLIRGMSPKAAVADMRQRAGEYNPRLLAALASLQLSGGDKGLRTVFVRELRTGMILDEDVRGKNGLLLVAKGQEVTYPVLEFLRSFSKGIGVVEPFRVLVPR
jgi:response regulator RpfG family c-di-GMP phosphodiesterase